LCAIIDIEFVGEFMNRNSAFNQKQLKLEKGGLKVDRKILASIVALATKEINGVSCLSDDLLNKTKNIFNKSAVPGVNVKFAENGNLHVDVYVTIYHGFSVPDVSFRIQENIKSNVATMIDSPVKIINVHVTGVSFNIPAEV
jgi:uncharacterized alkaline shock family protein YloU